MSHIPYYGEDEAGTPGDKPRGDERPAPRSHIRFGSNRRALELLDL